MVYIPVLKCLLLWNEVVVHVTVINTECVHKANITTEAEHYELYVMALSPGVIREQELGGNFTQN